MGIRMFPRKVSKVIPVRGSVPDDIFLVCGSFEERCLGAAQRVAGDFTERIVLFKFTEPNERRETIVTEIEEVLRVQDHPKRYSQIAVEHGKTTDGILKFHSYCRMNRLFSIKNLVVTIDITTFTKTLLLDILFFIKTFLHVETLRLLYTIPKNYASPEEGELSYGIKGIHILPFYWNGWSSTKDDLLIVILGYEEMRAWSLINNFDANVNLLFVTKPGSRDKWDSYCEKYNETLLKEIRPRDNVPALNPAKTCQILKKYIRKDTIEKYNIFISPLGTKPQLIGVFLYLISNPKLPINIVTTTPIEHNIPYYSWGIGDTFQFVLPLNGA